MQPIPEGYPVPEHRADADADADVDAIELSCRTLGAGERMRVDGPAAVATPSSASAARDLLDGHRSGMFKDPWGHEWPRAMHYDERSGFGVDPGAGECATDPFR